MRASSILLSLGLIVSACASDEDGGDDTLPKHGEKTTDPTIISATAICSNADAFKTLALEITASDPAGMTNLNTCAMTAGGMTEQGSFGASTTCMVDVPNECSEGADYVTEITVTNKTGGFVTASITVSTL